MLCHRRLFLRAVLSAVVLGFALTVHASELRSFSVLAAGAVGDGETLNTAALQRAIDACSAQGGGTVVFPTGRYLSGTLQLKDGVTLRLERDAVLLGSTNAADYRNLDPFTDGTGAELGYALVVAVGARQVGIEGTGTIDGQGSALKATQKRFLVRPFLIRWVRCTGIDVRDVQLRNAGAWTMHFFQSSRANVEGVTIRSKGLSNNDGIDIDSCDTVRVRGCDIDTGDDAICLKTTSAQPCRDVIVTGCTLTSHCAALKMGTESIGDFERIEIRNCEIRGARLGGIKLFSVDGGHVLNVVISDITMTNVTVPVMVRLGARLKTFRSGETAKPPGSLRDVTIKNLRVTNAQQIGLLISGVPGHPIENLSFENIDLALPGGGVAADSQVSLPENEKAYPEIRMFGQVMPVYGLYARHVRGLRFSQVKLHTAIPDSRPAFQLVDVTDVTPPDLNDLFSAATPLPAR